MSYGKDSSKSRTTIQEKSPKNKVVTQISNNDQDSDQKTEDAVSTHLFKRKQSSLNRFEPNKRIKLEKPDKSLASLISSKSLQSNTKDKAFNKSKDNLDFLRSRKPNVKQDNSFDNMQYTFDQQKNKKKLLNALNL